MGQSVVLVVVVSGFVVVVLSVDGNVVVVVLDRRIATAFWVCARIAGEEVSVDISSYIRVTK